MSIYYEPGTEGLTDPTHHLQAALEAVAETAKKLKEERDEAIADRDIARLSAQDSDRAHDRMVGELEKVYKERDDLREALSAAKHYLTKERDDALSQIVQAECRAERFCQERDEAREALAEEMKFHHCTHAELVQTQCQLQDARRERDEAREEAEYWKEAAKVPSGIFRSLEMARDQAKRDAEYYRARYEKLKDEREAAK